jgi:hypothetical protein
LGVIFDFTRAAHNENRSQSPQFAPKSSGCSPREGAIRSLAFIEAYLSRRRLSHLTSSSAHAGEGGPQSGDQRQDSANIYRDLGHLERHGAAMADDLGHRS